MVMEIPGVPYSEPAFSSIRPTDDTATIRIPEVLGVAYLITSEQYTKVIASEGGGIAYSELSFSARPLALEDEMKLGPQPIVKTLGTALRRCPPALPSQRYMVCPFF